MPADMIPMLAALFVIVGALYASVGHAGASGYLAVMALVGVDAALMRPTALTINILVATIAFVHFFRAGHFRWALFWPFATASMPAAFLGGLIPIPADAVRIAIGAVLLVGAVRMVGIAWRAHRPGREARPPALPVALAVGAAIGVVAGVTGTGGGIFLSPVMVVLGWADPKRTAATASAFILVNSVAGMAGLAAGGWTPPPSVWVLGACACAGGIVGAAIGSRRATPRALNLTLAAVLVVAGGKLVLS